MSIEISITADTERRLWALIRSVNTEIGGWGYAFQQDDGSFSWDQVFLVPQIVSHSEVDFETTGGDVDAIEKAVADGVLDNPRFCWVSWHSHHTMKPFWSSTDDKRIAELSKAGIKKLVSFVGCHDEKYRARLDVYDVQAHGVNIGQVTIDEIKLVTDYTDDEYGAAIQREVKANLRTRPTPSIQKDWKTQPKPPFPSPGTKYIDVTPKQEAPTTRVDLHTAFAIRDLIDEGFTTQEAHDLIEAHGLADVESMLSQGGIVAPWETLDADEVAALMVGDD